MKRFICILLIVIAYNIDVYAKGESGFKASGMTFGVGWGYTASLNTGHRYNFFAPEGYRVDGYGNTFTYISNAEVYAYMGYDLDEKWNLALYLGYEGIADMHKALPVSLRMTRYFEKNRTGDRWFSFLDFGSGISLKLPVQEIVSGKIGGGYRLDLGYGTSLDFIFSAKMLYTHPAIIYEKTMIPNDKINRSDGYVSSVSLGISLSF